VVAVVVAEAGLVAVTAAVVVVAELVALAEGSEGRGGFVLAGRDWRGAPAADLDAGSDGREAGLEAVAATGLETGAGAVGAVVAAEGFVGKAGFLNCEPSAAAAVFVADTALLSCGVFTLSAAWPRNDGEGAAIAVTLGAPCICENENQMNHQEKEEKPQRKWRQRI